MPIKISITFPQLEILMPTLTELLTAANDLLNAVKADEDADDAKIAQLEADLAAAKAEADPVKFQAIADAIAAAKAAMHAPAETTPPVADQPPAP